MDLMPGWLSLSVMLPVLEVLPCRARGPNGRNTKSCKLVEAELDGVLGCILGPRDAGGGPSAVASPSGVAGRRQDNARRWNPPPGDARGACKMPNCNMSGTIGAQSTLIHLTRPRWLHDASCCAAVGSRTGSQNSISSRHAVQRSCVGSKCESSRSSERERGKH